MTENGQPEYIAFHVPRRKEGVEIRGISLPLPRSRCIRRVLSVNQAQNFVS